MDSQPMDSQPAQKRKKFRKHQMLAILGPDMMPFEALVSDLTLPDEDKRSNAALLIKICFNNQPDTIALKLAHLVDACPSLQLREMAAFVLSKQLIQKNAGTGDYLWPRISPVTQNTLKPLLLSSVLRENSRSIANRLCVIISELATNLLPDGAWPELLQFMLHSVTSDSPCLQESALRLFFLLAYYISDALLPHLATLRSAFLTCLSSAAASPYVQIVTFIATVNLVQCLPSPYDDEFFQILLPAMMLTLNSAVSSGQEPNAQLALKFLIKFADTEPKFFRGQLSVVVSSTLQIAEAERLEEGTRHLAVEFIITLAEARECAPVMMQQPPQFIERLFVVLMKMLLDFVDDRAWHDAEIKDMGAGETRNYIVGKECLDRLSIALGGNTIFPVACEYLPAYLAAPEWQKRHAAFITLAHIAEGCSEVMMKNLEQVVMIILQSFQDPHPHVRWAAINAVVYLSIHLHPDLQRQYHQQVLLALVSAMDDIETPHVQACAASAIANFTLYCTPDVLTPYLDRVVSKLHVLLQHGKQMVQEGALTALASVADISQEHFQKYYDAVIPHLNNILMNATDKSNRMLCAKSIESISIVGLAVGKEKFKDDAKQVMRVLMNLQGSQMEKDDPTMNYIILAWVRLFKCLDQDFLPHIDVVMPPLLQSAQLKPDDESSDAITLCGKRKGTKSNVLVVKATACVVLCWYAHKLKQGFFPWIDQVATTLIPLLKFYLHKEVRNAAVAAMPKLLLSAKLAVEKGQAGGQDEFYVKQLSDNIILHLVKALHKEPAMNICANMLFSLNECIQISGPFLDRSQVECIVGVIKYVITASITRKRERSERIKAENFDAKEEELLKVEMHLEEILMKVWHCLDTLIKTFKASMLPFFDGLSTSMLGKDKTPEERRTAICIFDYLAEQCGDAALIYYDKYLPILLEACNDENPHVRQPAVYGVGVCAEFGGSVFGPFVGEAVSRLNFEIRRPNALHWDNVMAYENAVSALGKICHFHRKNIDAAQVVPAWLSCLPVKSNFRAAKVVHDLLCSMVERFDSDLLGPDMQYVPKILAVFTEVVSAGNDLATEQTASRMMYILRKLGEM